MAATSATGPPADGVQSVLKGTPSLLTRLKFAALLSTLRGSSTPGRWYRGWQDYFYPPEKRPNIIKTYDARPTFPVRIFFPSTYDQTSPQTLPLLFTLHGGGFCFGEAEEDDTWNRIFADLHDVLVVALNYTLAPGGPFPTAIHDIEALFLAVVDDESLPIDQNRVALAGFSAGGTLALAACQLPSVHNHAKAAPKAVIPIYPSVDFSVESSTKKNRRPYKKGLSGIRGEERDWVLPMAPLFDWAYTDYGADLADPLVSPFFAKRGSLPKYVFTIAAELDYLAYEAWQMSCRLAGKPAPSTSMAGREEKAKTQELELRDERFAWESAETGVRWLLVPDVIHAFDFHLVGETVSDKETVLDGQAKAVKYMKVMGEWLIGTVWR